LEFDWKTQVDLKESSNAIWIILTIHEIFELHQELSMRSKIVLFASIFVSVFLILTTAGIAFAMRGNALPAASNTQAASTNGSAPSADEVAANLSQQFATREASYQMLIAEANQRIETLNNEVASAGLQKSQASTQPGITAEKAVQIAMETTGGNESLLALPDLVSYQGTEAFEVALSDGSVYVDAKAGTVLFNGVTPKITSQQAGEIAGKYLGGMNPKYATIKLVNLNGIQIFQVTFSGDKEYVVYIDLTGNVIKAQIFNYASGGGGGGGSSSSVASRDDDHEGSGGDDD
jgi:uncharacterized membrane protein YkoI